MEDYRIYECLKCQIRRQILINEKFDFKCKCCGENMKYITTVRKGGNKQYNKDNYYHDISIQPQPQEQNMPKCPTCGSLNVKRIGGVERAASVGMFGLFSKKINKSFKCGNCGYTW